MNKNNQAWLSIVGIGEDGLEGVPAAGRTLIDKAEVVIGGLRHLEMLPADHRGEKLTWRSPLKDTIADIRALEGRPVCVLATGDPMSYGIGVTLGREFGHDALTVLPAVGAFSLAAARLGWPIYAPNVDCLTLHGRPLETINLHLRDGARLLILSEDGLTPKQLADHLTALGYGDSELIVLEHMDGPKEKHLRGLAKDWSHPAGADLNSIAVTLVAGPDAQVYSRLAGLPDDAFRHDGKMTKREVRAATLASLAPQPGELLWDVGGGSGSIAIEWMRAGGEAITIEKDTERCAAIAHNAARLGTPRLRIVEGELPDALNGLAQPKAIFIGGGLSVDGLLERCWDALPAAGRLAANAVTAEGETELFQAYQKWGGELSRIAVSRLTAVGPHHGWKPFMPVTHFCARKG